MYCCRGCEAAADIIRGAGLDRYYAERTELPPRPAIRNSSWSGVPVDESDGVCTARLAIDGFRCASCIWVTEAVLARTAGVVEASVSYASGRATLRWDPTQTDLTTLAERVAALGYRPRLLGEDAEPDRGLLMRLGVAAFSASNVMMFSAALYAGWVDPMHEGFATLFRWWTLILATPVAIWSGEPFFLAAWSALRNRRLHMDVPIALAVALLYGHGLIATFTHGDTYLDSLTMLVTLLLAGRWLESGGRRRAAEAAVALAASVPDSACRIVGDTLEWVPSSSLEPGDRIEIGAGEDIPADGVIVRGAGRAQRALLTGESRPVGVASGGEVWAGTILLDGSLTVRVTRASEDSIVSKMAAEVRAATDRGLRPDSVDRIAPWFTAATLGAAGATFLAWSATQGTAAALETTVAVLVVACPCALALARPLVASAGLGATARRGILFRSGDALLAAAEVDRVVLDKTGTVTAGELRVTDATDNHLRIAAGLERYSRHPLADAILREAVERGLPLPAGSDVVETVGSGIRGRVDGVVWSISGGPDDTVILRSDAGEEGHITFGDRVRADAIHGIDRLHDTGARVTLLTGDDCGPAMRIAAALGDVPVVAGADPSEKASWISDRRDEGSTVLFAGDGLNDGPALAAADVAVAMGSGAAASVLAADAVLLHGSVEPLSAAIRIGRICRRVVRANQIRSIAYNVAAVAAAAAGFVNPLVAAIIMPLSSLSVVLSAQRVESMAARSEDA